MTVEGPLRERAGVWSDGKYWRAAEPLTVDQFTAAADLVGRNGAPSLLFDLYLDGRVPEDVLRAVLVGVWSEAEFPESYTPRSWWVECFRVAAYRPPVEPLTLYRGCIPSRIRRMAWTTSAQQAVWFAYRFGIHAMPDESVAIFGTPERQAAEAERVAEGLAHGFRPAYVYTATVEPAGVLAVVDDREGDDGRGEAEVVIDPVYLPSRVKRAELP